MRSLAMVAMLGMAGLAAAPDASAQRAFARRFPAPAAQAVTVKGDIRLIGNHTLSCDPALAACATALAGSASGRNNDFNAVAVNVDPDGGNNINSSSATLTLPAGSTVLFAGLYWSGESATTARTTVRMRAPGGGYVTRTASVTDVIGSAYQSFADVTSVVAAAGSGVYTVANVAQTASGTGHWGGWTLVVAYQNASGTLRNLSVFDGFIYGNGTPPYQDINISGFFTPISGTVNTNLGLVVYDGDRGQPDGGNSLEFGPNTGALSAVFDAANPVNDVWNSSISYEGVPVTAGRNPASTNLLGVDIDNIKPNVPLPYGSSAAVLRVRSTSGDVNYPGVVSLATDAFEPEIVTSFTKTATDDNGGAFRPGDIVTYTISLTNQGNDNSTQTVVTDPLPAGVTYIPGSMAIVSGANAGAKTDSGGDDQGSYDAATRTVTFRVGVGANAANGGTVAPATGATLTFKVRIDPVGNGTNLANVAEVDYVSGTSLTAGHGSTPPSNFTVTGEAELSITKTAPATVSAGGSLTYTITVANAGPDAADGATFTDNLPAGFTATAVTCTPSGGATCPPLSPASTSGVVASLPSGGGFTVTITGTAPNSTTSLSNTATITAPSGTLDPTPGNNTSGPVATTVQPADLAVTNTASAGPHYVGQPVTYTIAVTNNGPATANAVSLDDTLPAGMTFVSLSAPAGWTATTPAVGAGGTISATIASLAPGATATFELVAQVSSGTANGTVLVDTATVSSGTADPEPANNTASASINVLAGADVSIGKTLTTAGPYREGQALIYTLVVANAGPVAATNVQVTDTPTNLTITGVSGAGCAALPCTIASLASGASATITVTATIVGPGAFDNVAGVSAAEPDPTPGNNGDSTGNGGTAAPVADLAVTIVRNGASPAPAGSSVGYTVTVTNNGPSAVSGAVLTTALPPQLNGATWTCVGGCQFASGTGDVNMLVDVAVGGTVNIVVTGAAPTVTPATIGVATATITVPAGTVDTVPANDSASAAAIPVSALPIDAMADAGSIGGAAGGTAIANVLANDTFNGTGATTATVTLTVVTGASTPNVVLNTATGAVGVAANTPAGTYAIAYRICETANPANCDDATATVTVTAAALVADSDAGTANGRTGGTAVTNVLANDTSNGATATLAGTVLTQQSTQHPNITLDTATGAVNVAPGTPAGSYTLVYRICEALNPANCVDGSVTVTVTAAVIDAVNDVAGPVPGRTGNAAVVNVLGNDMLGGAPAALADVVLAQTSASNAAIALDPAAGLVAIAPNTPAGSYTLGYRMCERLNPTNCDDATVTVAVSAAPIVAVDDVAGPIEGGAGGNAIVNVFGNDIIDGGAATSATATVTVTPPGTGALTLDANGDVNLAANTPAGTYTLTYRLCERLNPANCDDATVSVIVSAAPIVANDDASPAIVGTAGGVAVANVLANDTLAGAPATGVVVTLAQLSTTGPQVVLDAATGAVTVAPGTPAGTYAVVYRICQRLNPSNCDGATVAVTVTAAPIIANDDVAAGVPGRSGAPSVVNVLGNDALDGQAATPAGVVLTQLSTQQPNVTLDTATGNVAVASGTPAGSYALTYRICERLNPTNCDEATVAVTVAASPIVANDDAPPALVGATGGTAIANVLGNDTLGGASVTLGDVVLTQLSASGPAITLDAGTGAVNVAPGTPAGTYTLTYRICERLNPSNCDEATVTASVSAAVIDAVDDATPAVDGVAGNANVVNVLGNDTLGGAVATLSTTVLTQVSTSNPAITLDATTGNVAVAPGTPAGSYTLTYRLCEQLNPGNCDTATVTVTVVAPALVANDDTAGTRQNTAVVLAVLGNDTMAGVPVGRTAVTITIVDAPAHGSVVLGADGTATYTPATNYSGNDGFTYRICDVVNPTVCDEALATLAITPNTVEAVDEAIDTPQTGAVVIDPMNRTRNGGGAPLDPRSVTIVAPPSNGTVVVNPNGTITYTPNQLFFGTETLQYRICDRSVPTPVCDVATVTINVAMQAPQLRMAKTAPSRAVKVGDLVRYTVVIENVGIAPANGTTVVDVPPRGFSYVEGSMSVDDVDDAFGLAGVDPIRVTGIDVPVGGRATLVYVLRVGAGVGRGTHTNSVSATDATGSTVSNTSTADVTVEGDPTVDDSLIVGTVFADRNGDGVQQDDEPGLPGVRLATVEGLVIETDVHGRYHVAGIRASNALRGSNFILKVDAATLPPGSTFTTSNPLVRRITPGIPVRFDFGVSLPEGDDTTGTATR